MADILYKSKNAIVIYKPYGMPSQPDPSGTPDAYTLLKEALRAMGERDELYLIHRLDRVVSGLLIFARNKAAAAELSRLVTGEGIGKEYFAVIEGDATSGTLENYLVKNAAMGKALVVGSTDNGAKLARLHYKALASVNTRQGTRTLVAVKLDTGRFHQIRAQLSANLSPIVGDKKYGSRDYLAKAPALISHKLTLSLFDESISVSCLPDTSIYPWSIFSEGDYSEKGE